MNVLRVGLFLLRTALTFAAFALASVNAIRGPGIILAPVDVAPTLSTAPLTFIRGFGVLVIGGIRHKPMSNTAVLPALVRVECPISGTTTDGTWRQMVHDRVQGGVKRTPTARARGHGGSLRRSTVVAVIPRYAGVE